ncbi:hypothetical protein HYDPIDRAFT_37936 [Hydnomerulius pinastri MD-312]|nr:hypothetical protein HYDPIDRAFT_37936 [Hydnomerulius pinastri MD-312]
MHYYGYAVSTKFLLNEADKRGILCSHEGTAVLRAVHAIMWEAGILEGTLSSLKLVWGKPTSGGEVDTFWCIALATTDPRERLPKFRAKGVPPVPPERYEELKKILGMERPPMWFRYAS